MRATYCMTLGVVCALGIGAAALRAALSSPSFAGRGCDRPGYTGRPPAAPRRGERRAAVHRCAAATPSAAATTPLLLEALAADPAGRWTPRSRASAPRRIGVVLGTSTSGVGEAEAAWNACGAGRKAAGPRGLRVLPRRSAGDRRACGPMLARELGACGSAARDLDRLLVRRQGR